MFSQRQRKSVLPQRLKNKQKRIRQKLSAKRK